jgi:[NiFe] hydrogenase assembly HybE family chaperone
MTDTVLAADPSDRLVGFYARVSETSMRGLPFVNPALRVEAVDFAPWEGRWLGVLVTPWFVNLVLAPLDPAAWEPVGIGEKRTFVFPAGRYEFISAADAERGELLMCSLFSPVLQFEDQETVRYVAKVSREALFDAENAEKPPAVPEAEPAADTRRPLAQIEASLDAPLSRRDLLRGRILPGGDDAAG